MSSPGKLFAHLCLVFEKPTALGPIIQRLVTKEGVYVCGRFASLTKFSTETRFFVLYYILHLTLRIRTRIKYLLRITA